LKASGVAAAAAREMASGAKDVGILAMDIYFPPNCALQVPPQSFLPSRARRPRFAFSIARLPGTAAASSNRNLLCLFFFSNTSRLRFFLLGFRRLFGPSGVNSSVDHTRFVWLLHAYVVFTRPVTDSRGLVVPVESSAARIPPLHRSIGGVRSVRGEEQSTTRWRGSAAPVNCLR
jgi:hypothetical protein